MPDELSLIFIQWSEHNKSNELKSQNYLVLHIYLLKVINSLKNTSSKYWKACFVHQMLQRHNNLVHSFSCEWFNFIIAFIKAINILCTYYRCIFGDGSTHHTVNHDCQLSSTVLIKKFQVQSELTRGNFFV